jgi:hypothetical protein
MEEDRRATFVVDYFVLVFHLFRGYDKEVVGFRNLVYVIAVQRTFLPGPRVSVNFHLGNSVPLQLQLSSVCQKGISLGRGT